MCRAMEGGLRLAPLPPGVSKREKQFQAHRAFGDRRDGVTSARTYFYASEAKCDSHMETFLRCIEASGEAWAAPASGTLGGELEAGAGAFTQALVRVSVAEVGRWPGLTHPVQPVAS